MRVAVTGADGFLGMRIQQHLSARGHDVLKLSRRNQTVTADWRPYSLEMPASRIDLTNIQSVVHCAYDMKAIGADHLAINGCGAAELAEACRRSGTYLINVSSVLAASPHVSWYARTKCSIEVSVRGVRGTNLRLGLLTDFAVDPFARKLQAFIQSNPFPILPVPKGWVWQSSLESLLAAIEKSVNYPFMADTIWLGGTQAVSMKNHVAQICAFAGRELSLIELPLLLVKVCLWAPDKVSKKRQTFSIDALNGLSRDLVSINPN